MDKYFASNQELWDEWTGIHEKSEFYDLPGFKAGRLALDALERAEVGDVNGKTLLHLQCHFGMSTLSWARLGAIVTGVDFSEKAITLARSIGEELGIPATFVQANIYDLPAVLDAKEAFDIVFTSYGVLYWLPDMPAWAKVVAHFLKPGGVFHVIDSHPFAHVFDDEAQDMLRVRYPYFHAPEPMEWEVVGTYASPESYTEKNIEYGWQHSLGDIVNALTDAGLRIEHLKEYPYASWSMYSALTERRDDGFWWLKEGMGNIPMTYAIRATK
ncbi:MAG: class I SAM-dependent methyltransferase [Anaerolineae bacterium]|nr:class I SAM-dependent methyltransferase [Anaerolineae bacterium]